MVENKDLPRSHREHYVTLLRELLNHGLYGFFWPTLQDNMKFTSPSSRLYRGSADHAAVHDDVESTRTRRGTRIRDFSE